MSESAPRRFRWGFAVLGLVVVGLIAWLAFGHKKPAEGRGPPPVAVSVAKATTQDVQLTVNAIGAAQAWQGVLIRAQVNGKLLSVPVREGADVKAGDLLAQIDPAPYQAVLTQAQGQLKRDEALLAGAKVDLNRYQTLVSQDSLAKQTLDTQTALVKQYEGTVMADQGVVAAAKTNLNFTRIVAPIAGRVGVRLVDPGNLVSTTDTNGIISVNQVTPIAVTFTVPEGDFQRLSDVSDGFRRPMATQATSQEDGAMLGAGELSIADNHVDAATASVALKARFPNGDRRLWPGQLVNVQLALQTLPQAVVVPDVAVNQGPRGQYVYVVNGNTVAVRPVTLVTVQGPLAVIKTGLQAGETVVTDGQLQLRPGAKIRVHGANPGANAGGPGGGGKGKGKGKGRRAASADAQS